MIIRRIRAWWTGLGRRERVLTAIAAAAVMSGLIYSIAIEPAWKTEARLRDELPRLQADLVQIRALHQEAQRLAGRAGAEQSLESLRKALEQSILRANLGADVSTNGVNQVAVTVKNVSGRVWLSWLESFIRETRASVVDASIQRAGAAGLIDASASFQTNAS
ncbi:MAG: type II secretion system protein GspM [Burkholderiales bacterium]|jgi:type II secretory pathway component PulM